jgi:hypothetical protein
MELSKMENTTLGVVDYVVFAAMLLLSASIGVYYRCTGGKQKTTKVRAFLLFIHFSPCMFKVVIKF